MKNNGKKIYRKFIKYCVFLVIIVCILNSIYFRNLILLNQMPIQKIDSIFCLIRIMFMNKPYGFQYGFVYPNMISLLSFLLVIMMILFILEDNKNFSYSEYHFLQYRLAKKNFLNYFVWELIKKYIFLFILICFSLFFFIDKSNKFDFFFVVIYVVRLFCLLFEIMFFRQIFQIIYKKEQMVLIQYSTLILMTIIDNYSNLNLITMSSSYLYEAIYIFILVILITLTYSIVNLIIKYRKEFL